MRFTVWFLFAALLSTPFARAAKSVLADYDTDELKSLRELEKNGAILHATCGEVANTVLGLIGLPLVGQPSSVQGDRLDVDRRGERNLIPKLKDGVTRKRKAYSETYRIETGIDGVSGQDWSLKLTREIKPDAATALKPLKLETRFVFERSSRVNSATCDLKFIEFASEAYTEAQDLHDCLAIRELTAHTASEWVKDERLFGWIKEDCRTALHYFKDSKEILLEDSRKKIR